MDPKAFFADCRGKVLRRAQFAYLGVSDSLISVFFWGHLRLADIEEWIEVLRAQNKKRDVVIQAQHLTGIDDDAIKRLVAFMRQDPARANAVTSREAIVAPAQAELLSLALAGFYQLSPPSYPNAVFASLGEALDWLGVLDRKWIVAHSVTPDPLGAYFAKHLRDASLDGAAADMHVARRTLQRRLADAGVRFEDALARARVDAAKDLLLRTQHDLKRIATDVGFKTPARLSQVFRQLEGTSPSEWRELNRSSERSV